MSGPVTSAIVPPTTAAGVAGIAEVAGIAGVVAARATTEPALVALEVDGGDVLTYGAWDARSNSLARGLVARGAGAGDRIGLLFGGPDWADFAVAHLGVLKVGAQPVHFSAGASSPDLARALARSGVAGLLRAPGMGAACPPSWTACVKEVAEGFDAGPVAAMPVASGVPDDLVYLSPPLGPARLLVCGAGQAGPVLDGCLVHAWAPGTVAGRHALRMVQVGPRARAVALATFDADRLCALVAERRAVACGLSPALAAALLASGAASRHDVSSVATVAVSGSPRPQLLVDLGEAFPFAAVAGIADPRGEGPSTVIGADAPVAVSQEGMLWHECFTPGSFNLPCLVRRYQGPIDVDAFGWALSEMVRRHQPLRSTFAVVDGAARQVVGDGAASALASVDLSALDPADRDAEVARVLADATGRPFDLVSGPLFQPRLLRLGHDDHLLVVRLHHTVFDDWSVDVFRRELSALYTARVGGAPSPLAEPPTSFADHCRRQRARLGGDVGVAQRSWWGRELDGAPLAVQLPVAGEGDAEPGEPLRLDLPPALAAALRSLAPTLRATPFMTMLAAFSVLLGRVTGQDDLVISTVVAHRNRSELEALVGCFTKKVPLRLRLEGDPTFPDLVARTRASLLGSLSHQDVAFDAAVQEGIGRPAADHGVVAQVSVVFQGETPQQVKLALSGLTAGPYDVRGEARRERHFTQNRGEGTEPVWGDGIYLGTFLILSLLETAEGMALVARGVFDRPAGRRLLENFQSLLEQVVADPSRPVSELGPSVPAPFSSADVVELRGLRASRSRVEAALARCAGVAEVAVAVREDSGGEARLVAYVVAGAGTPPTVAGLRQALWQTLPGAPWPCRAIGVLALPRLEDDRLDLDRLPAPDDIDPGPGPAPDPIAVLLTAMWSEIAGRRMTADTSYWQDFSFLQVLAEAREAGLALSDERVVRCRTPEMLAVALTAGAPFARA